MTRTERTIVLHWRGIATACAIIALFGIAWATWHRIDASDRRADGLAAEADLRGTAVSTLAGDVRALRAQVQAEGATPVAPDPTRAVKDLPDRAEVPVPIPGPRGAPGSPGPSGAPGKTGKDGTVGPSGAPGTGGAPGADSTVPGPQGVPGADSTVPGPRGERGETGAAGERGPTGPAGPACPDGYSLQAPSYDPDALVCRKGGAPSDGGSAPSGPIAVGLDPTRREYP